jgi:hypothetical protein
MASSGWISTLGDTLLRPDGSKVELADALAGQSVLGLYFSAHWWYANSGLASTEFHDWSLQSLTFSHACAIPYLIL